jgi:hypothetical protein
MVTWAAGLDLSAQQTGNTGVHAGVCGVDDSSHSVVVGMAQKQQTVLCDSELLRLYISYRLFLLASVDRTGSLRSFSLKDGCI